MDLVKASLEYVFDASLRVHEGAKPCLTLSCFCRRSCHFVRGFCATAAAQHHHQVGRMLCAGPVQPHYDQFRRMCCPVRCPARSVSTNYRSLTQPSCRFAMRTHFFSLAVFASVLQPLARLYAPNLCRLSARRAEHTAAFPSPALNHRVPPYRTDLRRCRNNPVQSSLAATGGLRKRFAVQTHRYRLTKGCPPPP